MDAAQVVDLVDEAVALARRDRRVGRVVGAAHVDALRRAHARAELAADALLHAVLVAIEDVTAVEALGLRALLEREPLGDLAAPDLAQRDREAAEPAHQRRHLISSSSSRLASATDAYSVPPTTSAPTIADGQDDPHRPALVLRDHDDAGDHHPEEGDLDEELPAERHELVVAQPRHRGAHPDRAEQQQDHLEHEPEHRHDPRVEPAVRRRGSPSAGPDGPPKKSVTAIADIVMRFMNSAR